MKIRLPSLPLILCVIFAILARVTGIIYSFLATDVVYSDSMICQILPAIRQVLSALSFASAAGEAVKRISAHISVKLPVLVYSAVLLADGATVILYDHFSGVLEGRLFFAIAYRLGLATYSIFMLIIGIGIASAILKRKKSTVWTAVIVSTIPIAIDFVIVLWNCITSLIEWEFIPFASEVYTMIFEIATVVISGVLSAVLAAALVKVKDKE